MNKIGKLIRLVQEHLDPEENIITSVLGAYETKIMGKDTVRNGIFLATDKRLVFYSKRLTGFDLEIFPYENISSIEMGKGLMGHHISFFASGNKVRMKWINHGNIELFVSEVKARIGKKSESNNIPAPDVADQIKKLAELKESGILTEEEFNLKKQDLLARM